MKVPPYSLNEAIELCADYQFLSGRNFDNTDSIIRHIVVAPFDEESKEIFLLYFRIVQDSTTILTEVYSGMLFDILVIGKSVVDQNEVAHQSLHSWWQANTSVSERSNMADAIKASIQTSVNTFNLN